MPTIATNTRVSREELLDFVRTRHHLILVTTRADGRPQLSPVTGGVDDDGRIVISTYPDRAKATNLRRNPRASVLVLSDEWNDAWVQVDGTAEVLDMFPHEASRLAGSAPPDTNPRGVPERAPSQEAEDGLVDYFRCISGEHPDWDEYRQAMRRQGKSLVRITPDRWGPVATGGFPGDRGPGRWRRAPPPRRPCCRRSPATAPRTPSGSCRCWPTTSSCGCSARWSGLRRPRVPTGSCTPRTTARCCRATWCAPPATARAGMSPSTRPRTGWPPRWPCTAMSTTETPTTTPARPGWGRPTTGVTTTTRSGTARSWSSPTATARPSTGSPSRST